MLVTACEDDESICAFVAFANAEVVTLVLRGDSSG